MSWQVCVVRSCLILQNKHTMHFGVTVRMRGTPLLHILNHVAYVA